MGLAAQQARLLTITARKSDCEYDSMRLSHEKLSISRDLEKVSNEYQNSLDQTKLMYDFYGNGTSSEQLKYNLLMSPSALNDYMPITVTNSAGRVVLNSAYAAAAKAAGIPQEGLGCVPSSAVRSKFLIGLGDAGVIDKDKAKLYASTDYNQNLGVGETNTKITYTIVDGKIDDLLAALGTGDDGAKAAYNFTKVGEYVDPNLILKNSNGSDVEGTSGEINIAKLLSSDPGEQYNLISVSHKGKHYPVDAAKSLAQTMTGFIESLYNGFSSVLTTGDPRSTAALNYAKQETLKIFAYSDADVGSNNGGGGDKRDEDSHGLENLVAHIDRNTDRRPGKGRDSAVNAVNNDAPKYVGITAYSFSRGGLYGRKTKSAAGVNLNNVAKAFLSNFAKYMEGLPTKDGDNGAYYGKKGDKTASELVTNDATYTYYFPGASKLPEDDSKNVTFYDTLLNKICTSGWTENNEIEDASYLQQMLQNGMMFVTRLKDDGFYYQGNYATDSYIKEVTDETAVAQAEARYNTTKAKLNSKEQTLDLKMKNLDTEISSLTTEYDTVKNTISKNIEKSFKRYNA